MSKSALSYEIYVSRTENGKFIASSVQSPYFCFEHDEEAQAVDLASKALAFYTEVLKSNPARGEDKATGRLVRSHKKTKRTINTENEKLVAA